MARNVRVILTEDLPNVGRSGELCKVRPGFARNFLIPRGLAALATTDNVHRLDHERRVAEARAAKLRSEAELLAGKLGKLKVTVARPVGEGDKLYGSVGARDIADALAEQGFEIDRRKILVDAIKELGTFPISIKIASGVDAVVQLEVVAKSKEQEA
jgi:large subunit ribosomal protein L9